MDCILRLNLVISGRVRKKHCSLPGINRLNLKIQGICSYGLHYLCFYGRVRVGRYEPVTEEFWFGSPGAKPPRITLEKGLKTPKNS